MGLKPGPAPTTGAAPALPAATDRRPGCALAGFGLPVGAGVVVVVVADGSVWMSGAFVCGALPQPTSRPAAAAQASTTRAGRRTRYKEPPGTPGGKRGERQRGPNGTGLGPRPPTRARNGADRRHVGR